MSAQSPLVFKKVSTCFPSKPSLVAVVFYLKNLVPPPQSERLVTGGNISKKDTAVGVFEGQTDDDPDESNILLPVMKESEHVVHDYATTSLSLKAIP